MIGLIRRSRRVTSLTEMKLTWLFLTEPNVDVLEKIIMFFSARPMPLHKVCIDRQTLNVYLRPRVGAWPSSPAGHT